MDKFGRVLIIIFFLTVANLGLNFYILSKLHKQVDPSNKSQINEKLPQTIVATKTATPSATPITPPTIQSDLNLIKAEIRTLRESLESTGLILQTPEP